MYWDTSKLFRSPNLTIDHFRSWKIGKKSFHLEMTDASTIILIMFCFTRWSNKLMLTIFCSKSVENLLLITNLKKSKTKNLVQN
jgi:hypothetical protein